MSIPATRRRSWPDLDEATQTALLVAFGHHLDTLPPTCSMATKEARLGAWLAARGIDYPGVDPDVDPDVDPGVDPGVDPSIGRRHQTTTGQ